MGNFGGRLERVEGGMLLSSVEKSVPEINGALVDPLYLSTEV